MNALSEHVCTKTCAKIPRTCLVVRLKRLAHRIIRLICKFLKPNVSKVLNIALYLSFLAQRKTNEATSCRTLSFSICGLFPCGALHIRLPISIILTPMFRQTDMPKDEIYPSFELAFVQGA
jgi:hypothetical protein